MRDIAPAAGPTSNARRAAATTGPAATVLTERRSVESHEANEGERKTVTALFADIKGSMELMEDLDPEEARAIIDPALKLMIDAVRDTTATSCNPSATEFSRCSARRWRTRTIPNERCMQRSRCKMSLSVLRSIRGGGRKCVQARVGINTGEAVVRKRSLLRFGRSGPHDLKSRSYFYMMLRKTLQP